MGDASPAGLTRRQFLVGGAAGATAVWVAPKLGWWARAGALPMDLPGGDDGADVFGQLPFSDDFNEEFPGALLTKWNVLRPIQLAGMTQFGVPCPANDSFDSTGFLTGHGITVAMDGLLGAGTGPGLIETVQAFAFPAGVYRLSFQVAGSHHGAEPWPATLRASLPGCDAAMTVSRAASDAFRRYTLKFEASDPKVSTIMFESGDGPGQAGLLLDDVSLVAGELSEEKDQGGD